MIASRPTRNLLLVNPLIHDFAAYDFWARPLGLLTLGGLIRAAFPKALLAFLDCVDPCSPWLTPDQRPRRGAMGRGRFFRTPIARPERLPRINRRYSRYGLPPDAIRQALVSMFRPDLVLVTSMMTYWYPGVVETIDLIRLRWPEVPILLGGVYATLCPDHARANSGADRVLVGPAHEHLKILGKLLEEEPVQVDPRATLPAHELLQGDSAAICTSLGCPRRCPYCGVHALHPRVIRSPHERVKKELRALAALGIKEIALYDDALLTDQARALDILGLFAQARRREGSALRLHAASGLSCRGLTLEVAHALRAAGFATIRLGFETADPVEQQRLGGKVTGQELAAALEHLETAGYPRQEIGVYAMVGLPGQRREEVKQTVDLILGFGAKPHLAEYSPIPLSPLFSASRRASELDLDEPLFHNPTLLPCAGPDLDGGALEEIRRRIRSATAPPRQAPDQSSWEGASE